MEISPKTLADALRSRRFETARRIGRALIRQEIHQTSAVLFDLHNALKGLGDLHAAVELLTEQAWAARLDPAAVARALSEDFKTLSGLDHYRISAEARAGLTADEYKARYLELSREQAVRAAQLSGASEIAPPTPEPIPPVVKNVSLEGKIVTTEGAAITGATITVGSVPECGHPREVSGVEFTVHTGEPITHTAVTDDDGRFALSLPQTKYDFLAVTSEDWEISTRFLMRDIDASETKDLGVLTVGDWQSVPHALAESPHPSVWRGARKLAETRIANPFDYDFPRQLLLLPLPPSAHPANPCVVVFPGVEEPAQLVGNEVALMISLPARRQVWIAIYEGQSGPHPSPLALEKGDFWQIETGPAAFRIASETGTAPITSMRGADGIWRGTGRFNLPDGIHVKEQRTTVLEQGPVLLKIRIETHFSNGSAWSVDLTALAGEPVLLVHETSQAFPGAAFEFSLREFSGGRGFLHWTPEHGNRHWSTLSTEDRVIAQLPESVPWWIPPQGFACAMTPDGLEETDYLAVFTTRRGEWIDREFARLSRGPIDENGAPNHELDWPYPEMVGSSISWITAQTSADGDAFFRLEMFDGERHWGLLASSLGQNDGDDKILAAAQHANSSPRLQDFKDWHFDEADGVSRPHHLVRRNRLSHLRRKKSGMRFRPMWEKIRTGKVPGPARGLAFAVEGDPGTAWKRRIELLAAARLRSRMTLLGRDRGDLYSPVGGRPITQDAEDYDLIAASGVFSAAEEREVRAYLILMGHMFMERDLMNWNFNSRNANFEADRVEVGGTIGLVFPGHPDSGKFLDHVVERTRSSLEAYCTPASGKWYENPACYYLHASKCRMALLYHLSDSGRIDLREIPRLKEFLRWGIILLTPPQPISYALMRDGGEESFSRARKIRKVPPIGDHASLGAWLPEHYAFIGKLFARFDPAFGRELLEAYFLASGDALDLQHGPAGTLEEETSPFGNLPLLFTLLEDSDIPDNPRVHLASRRLEGFGAVLRDNVNTGNENYVLIKQGPGGYRYHRTEGSFLLFADGRPLVYEGGEGGETWRHSTLSFYETHMPLAVGRIERFYAGANFQFSQGVHPQVIRPGNPVFLSDSCDHRLVPESHRRFRMEPPAVSRAFAWIGSRYLLVHDEIETDIPWHWHLQVVADGETGSAADGFHFKGRFGRDLVVQFPDQSFPEAVVENLPFLEHRKTPGESFSTRHLRLSRSRAKSSLAILMPVKSAHAANLHSHILRQGNQLVGTRVETPETRDTIWLARSGCTWSGGNVQFEGRYGACLEQGSEISLVLVGPGLVRNCGLSLRSEGPCATLRQTDSRLTLQAQGAGRLIVDHEGKRTILSSSGEGEWQLD